MNRAALVSLGRLLRTMANDLDELTELCNEEEAGRIVDVLCPHIEKMGADMRRLADEDEMN